MQKVKRWRVFDAKRKGLVVQKKNKESEGKEKWVQEEGDHENKRSNKKGNEKRMKEKLDERKPQKRSKIDKNYMWKVFVRKNAFLEWKRIEKTRKKPSSEKKTLFVRFLLMRKICEGE